MPEGPGGEKRPADAIGRAIMVAKIATDEVEQSVRFVLTMYLHFYIRWS